MYFNRPVNPGGYAWWYIDAVSDDGAQALTVIGFIGSVFSPYYAWANRKTSAQAENHCAINVALYQPRGGYWAMTERGAGALRRSESSLHIGPSALHWDGTSLSIEINEVCAPLPRRLRGHIKLSPGLLQPQVFHLDPGAKHRWQPIAPRARVEVDFPAPGISWSGEAYFDSNDGDVPLAQDFASWQWARLGNKIIYDVEYADGSRQDLALDIGADGTASRFAAPPEQPLPATLWRVERRVRCDPGGQARLLKTLEDAPFYARSRIATQLGGAAVTGMHEALSLKRFSSPWVRALLPFRMPRTAIG